MRSTANIINKLCLLVVLTAASFIQNINAAQDDTKLDMPTLDELLAEPGTQAVSTKETSSPVIPDANKIVQTKPVSQTFFSRLKDFFTFKSKKHNIKTVEAEPLSKMAEDNTESFVDLGNNKLKAIIVDEKDKADPLTAFKQSQNAQSDAQDKAAASLNSKLNTTATTKDSAVDSSAAGVNNTLAPSLASVQEQGNVIQQANQNNTSVTADAVATKSSGAVNNSAAQSTKTSQSSSKPNIANTIAEAPKAPVQATSGPDDVAKSPASLTPVPNEISANDIPKLPEIPDNYDDDAKNMATSQASSASSMDTQKEEISNLATNSNELKEETAAPTKDKSAKPVPATAQNSEIPTVTTVPEVPSVPIESVTNSLPTDELDQTNEYNDKIAGAGNLSNLSKFVIDEAKVLLLPNDDVVQGELTDSASYEQMDFLSYSKLFESQLNLANNYSKREVIDNFLKNYDANFNKVTILTDVEAASQAFNALSKNNLFVLRALLDNNSLLQAKNERGDTLLHTAVELDNYFLAEFLIIRGVNLLAYNDRQETPYMISQEFGNDNISKLLESANARIK